MRLSYFTDKIRSFLSFKETDITVKLTDRFLLTGSLIIIILGIYTTYDVSRFSDILFWDETLYMEKGLKLWHSPSLDWGPFYNFWYKLLSYFTQDKIELYYLNIKILSTLLPLVLFIFLMVNNINPVLSFCVSILFMYSFMNLPVWPKVSHWCLIVFLVHMIIARYARNIYVKFIIILCGMILCSYIRPEFYLAYLLFTAYTILHFIVYRKQYSIKYITAYIFVVAILFGIVKLIGNPVNAGGNGRMLITFGQHFAYNYCNWNHLKFKPFWIDWVFYLQDNFMNISKGEMVKIFLHHIFTNIITYATAILKIIVSFIFPLFHKYLNIHSILLVSLSFLVISKFSSFTKPSLGNIKSSFQTANGLQKILFIFCIPTLVSSIIAYPRAHYVLLQIPFFLILFVLFFQSYVKTETNFRLLGVITVLLFFAKPSSDSFDYFDLLREKNSLCNVTTVRYLKENFKEKQLKVFDLEGNINSALPSNFNTNSVDFFTSHSTVVSRYIDSSNTDIIYVTPTLLYSRFTEKDTLLKNWIASPEKYGFKKIKTGNFDAYLLSRLH